MAKPGNTIEDALSGARILFRRTAADTGGALLQMDVSARPRWSAGPLHIHPRQEERVHVLDGRLRSSIGADDRDHGPGNVVAVPPGTPHTFENAGEDDVRLLVEFRPALRTEELFQAFLGLGPGRRTPARLAELLRMVWRTRGYRNEIRLAWRPLDKR